MRLTALDNMASSPFGTVDLMLPSVRLINVSQVLNYELEMDHSVENAVYAFPIHGARPAARIALTNVATGFTIVQRDV